MDPNVTLATIRDANLDYGAALNTDDAIDAADRALSAFAALDSWLRVGGYLPTRWESAKRS